MSLEGSHEIETAKKRLAAAKSQASAATKHKEMIAKLLDSANASQMQQITKCRRHRKC